MKVKKIVSFLPMKQQSGRNETIFLEMKHLLSLIIHTFAPVEQYSALNISY